ncbi:MAG: apolipoprotein N-acyltransferase [Bacteroidales bacterium]|nr:apolipoprotein N-acyltransferase [Bacteroidales bacterium]
MSKKTTIWMLLGISTVLMSLPFLVPHCGFMALFGLVPLLCADKISDDAELKHFWLKSYLFFLAWNLITTFWVCNATVGGGIFASVANALQMAVIFGLFRLSKRKFRGTLPYLFLMFAWIAWERYYLNSAQISWPWLVLGNAFARSIGSIQWYEYTGTLGGSLWVWACNLSVFGMMTALGDGRFFTHWNIKARIASVVGLLVLIAGPFFLSAMIWNRYEESDEALECLILQPNFDPYHKFEFLTQKQQDSTLVSMINEALESDGELPDSCRAPLLLVAPETFTSNVVTNDITSGKTWQTFLSMLQNHRNANILFGASSREYIFRRNRPSYTARPAGDGVWSESHNSALIMNCTGETSIFHKSKLVVGVEMTPYPSFFTKIDDRLGGVMGRCIGQDEITILNFRSEDESICIPLGCAICYESIYGEYCTGYIRKGARALIVITNDAWWGNTPGYKQHCSYSSLRAIETRRDIARCANTGISCFIDQRGRILEKSDWWKKETLRGQIKLNDRLTFFSIHGDIVGRVSTFCFLLLLLSLIIRFLTRR